MSLLDDEGLDGVTTRRLAARLGVQSPTLYWHVPNKAALVTALAEAILEQQFPELTPPSAEEPWQDWLSTLAQRLRRALLAHPDGARVLSAAQLCRKMAAISELAMGTLVTRGVPLRQARVIVLTVERFTFGHVLEEQAPRPDAAALKDFDMAAFAEQHPTLIAGITEYFQDGRTVDDLFRECLEVVIEGAAAKSGTAP
ncbi:TetR/AcrR family transcriptional regulator C-terminal domain-containing protein [Actinospica durhamensis]|uniref:TetR/AcrR family transcriptional regulator C-terminal domain-containing protein n=1 Tax=Actinospica durhamensis TaxID=1508375 RepID=A0A941INM1_9ACTN|nr:TetR/AcrR family transcriptional regulator C-terminal domain-containing protein [Actinospica durhamensis]